MSASPRLLLTLLMCPAWALLIRIFVSVLVIVS